MAILTEHQFNSTMGTPMTLLQPDDDFRPVPLGDYVGSIPDEDFAGNDFTAHDIERVYRDPTQRWIHVMMPATTPNVYLVIVVDEPGQSIFGHQVLDLNHVYGTAPAT